jgi:hypothetical protein
MSSRADLCVGGDVLQDVVLQEAYVIRDITCATTLKLTKTDVVQ